jgi:hypothetical protein
MPYHSASQLVSWFTTEPTSGRPRRQPATRELKDQTIHKPAREWDELVSRSGHHDIFIMIDNTDDVI